jgi:hypothetical protein
VDALALAHDADDPEVEVRVLGDTFNAHVETEWGLDQVQAAAEALVEAARHLDTQTYLNVEAHVSATLAEVAQRQGDVASARAHAERALRYIREHGFVLWAAQCLRVRAWVADGMGFGVRAARLLGASAAEAERHGIPGHVEYRERAAAQARIRATLGEEEWAVAFAAGQTLTLEQAIAEALDEIG